MENKYRGIYAVVGTAFNEQGELDEAAQRRHIRWLIDECMVHGIIPCGSTGEFAFLSDQERKRVVEITVDEVNQKLPVIAGSATCATREVVKTAQRYTKMGVDGVMIVPPYYGKLSQEELYCHFASVAENVNLPIVLYNNPGTSGSDMLPATIARLAKFDNIVAVKESTGSMQRIIDIRMLAGDAFEILCGCDTLAMEMFAMGVEGWIAAPANIAAKQCVKLYQLMIEQKDFEKGYEYYKHIRPLFDLFEGSGQYVALVKAGLEMLGRPIGQPRKPLLPASDELRAQLKTLLEKLQ
ncbi:MAG TPA: 4-hydroxy-tetrahydrodipicolinate synthase [Anaerolineaceae bacterium]|nr:4-hydroxy-tetrahydrodipicolinate synthase [Anaerolineaceae bacterium]